MRNVDRNRDRLVREASKARADAVKRLREAIKNLEHARSEAVAALRTERWAREYPEETLDIGSLQPDMIKGGRRSRAVPNITSLTAVAAVLGWLRDDADWLDRVLADDEEERKPDASREAVWTDSPEGRETTGRMNKRIADARERATREAEWE